MAKFKQTLIGVRWVHNSHQTAPCGAYKPVETTRDGNDTARVPPPPPRRMDIRLTPRRCQKIGR